MFWQVVQGLFKNKEACPKPDKNSYGNIFVGGFPCMPWVKHVQFLTRHPMLRSNIANSSNPGHKYGKT